MFKVNSNPTFTHEVEIKTPVDGGFKTETIKTTFRLLPDDVTLSFNTRDPEGQKDFVRAIVVKMDGLVDEKDKPLDYNDELRDRVIAIPYVRQGMFNAYVRAISAARLGN